MQQPVIIGAYAQQSYIRVKSKFEYIDQNISKTMSSSPF